MQERLAAAYAQVKAEEVGGNIPAYAKVRRAVELAIAGGGVAPGVALPPERALTGLFGVSRITVRKALADLVTAGRLTQRQGAGTFVADRIVKNFAALSSFTEDLKARGLDARSVFVSREIAVATPEEAMAMALSPGAKVARLTRIRYADDKPLALERSSVPAEILPDPEVVTGSLYAVFDRLGCRPVRALQRLRAVNFDVTQAKKLEVPAGTAGLFIERRAFGADGRVVEFTQSHYRGDAYDFVAELQSE